jgi:hypothetical protein
METEQPDGPDQAPALPRGFCDACLQRFAGRSLPTAGGGRLVGGLCPHNRTMAVIQHLPDGRTTAWRMQTPATEADLHEWMALLAGAVAGIVEAEQRAVEKRARHLASLN